MSFGSKNWVKKNMLSYLRFYQPRINNKVFSVDAKSRIKKREGEDMLDINLAPVCGLYCGICEYLKEQCQRCSNIKIT